MTITLPGINMNGDSASELYRLNCAAHEAVINAITAVQNAAPHGRNYQTMPQGSYQAAIEEHRQRLLALHKIRNELEEISLHCGRS